MLTKFRKLLFRIAGPKLATSVLIGSNLTKDGERSIALRLVDGWVESAARLSPEGARAIARQLNEWADWAEKGRAQEEWQSIIRYAHKGVTTEWKEVGDIPPSQNN